MSSGGALNIAEGVAGLITTLGPLGVDLYLKLRQIGQLGPDAQQNIHDQIAQAISIDEDTKAKITAWQQSVGSTLPPAPTPEPVPATTEAPAAPAEPSPAETTPPTPPMPAAEPAPAAADPPVPPETSEPDASTVQKSDHTIPPSS